MEYYKDLTYYSHFHYERAKNIGFGKQFSENKESRLDPFFLETLTKYLEFPLNTTRGGNMRTKEINGVPYTFGFSEIRVMNSSGIIYAAPDEMIANVIDGGYIPPREFIDAVMYGPDPESEVYQDYLKRYRPEYCWGESNDYVKDVVLLLDMISKGNMRGLEQELNSRKELLNIVCGGGSLLNEAITRKQEMIAVYLIERGIALELFEGIELLTAVEMGMDSLVKILLEHNIPIKMNRPRTNPLFLAIGRMQNSIAEFLYCTRKDLVQVYTTEYVQDCNILQWTKMCNNTRFMEFLTKQF